MIHNERTVSLIVWINYDLDLYHFYDGNLTI